MEGSDVGAGWRRLAGNCVAVASGDGCWGRVCWLGEAYKVGCEVVVGRAAWPEQITEGP